jgi:hypothetical protein
MIEIIVKQNGELRHKIEADCLIACATDKEGAHLIGITECNMDTAIFAVISLEEMIKEMIAKDPVFAKGYEFLKMCEIKKEERK